MKHRIWGPFLCYWESPIPGLNLSFSPRQLGSPICGMMSLFPRVILWVVTHVTRKWPHRTLENAKTKWHVSPIRPRQPSYSHIIDDFSYHVSSKVQSYTTTWPPRGERKRPTRPCFRMHFLYTWILVFPRAFTLYCIITTPQDFCGGSPSIPAIADNVGLRNEEFSHHWYVIPPHGGERKGATHSCFSCISFVNQILASLTL